MLEQKLYTVADVAELTGLTSRTIRNYLKDGTLRGKKIGVQWRFTEEDINRLFSEVDGEGQKVMRLDDVISVFLKETKKKQPEGCVIIDIPFTGEEDKKKYKKYLREQIAEVRGRLTVVCEDVEEDLMLRIAISGMTEDIEEFTAGMRRF